LGCEIRTDEKVDSARPDKPETGWTVVQNRKPRATDGVRYSVPVETKNEKEYGMTETNDRTGDTKGVEGGQRAHPHKKDKKPNSTTNHNVSSEETNEASVEQRGL
jgi:hypothetical protein